MSQFDSPLAALDYREIPLYAHWPVRSNRQRGVQQIPVLAELGRQLRRPYRNAMNTAERVVHFLRSRQGQPFCDDCIVEELRLSKPVTRMTDQIGIAPKNRREVTVCNRCGGRKFSTMVLSEIQNRPLPKSN